MRSLAVSLFALVAPGFASFGMEAAEDRTRVLVLTDISNEYDVEGLVATTGTWLRRGPRPDLILRQIDAYAQVRRNLLRHAPGYPEPDALRAVTAAKGESTSFVAPAVKGPETIHVILELEDRGSPSLFAYRRAVIEVHP